MTFTETLTFRRHRQNAEDYDVTVTIDKRKLARWLGGRAFNAKSDSSTDLLGAVSATIKRGKPNGQ